MARFLAEVNSTSVRDLIGAADFNGDSKASPYPGASPVALKPFLYPRPKLLNADLQVAAEKNVVSSLERHRPGAAHDLAQILNGGE